jgi:hypothetical protein
MPLDKPLTDIKQNIEICLRKHLECLSHQEIIYALHNMRSEYRRSGSRHAASSSAVRHVVHWIGRFRWRRHRTDSGGTAS